MPAAAEYKPLRAPGLLRGHARAARGSLGGLGRLLAPRPESARARHPPETLCSGRRDGRLRSALGAVDARRRRRAEPVGGLLERLVDRRITRWPASKARKEAIMSTIERAGSAPMPRGRRRARARRPGRRRRRSIRPSPILRAFCTAKTPTAAGRRCRRRRRARAGRARARRRRGRRQRALRRQLELAVARVADALRRLDGEEALALDGEVERLAGVAQRGRGQVGDHLVDLDARGRARRSAGRLPCSPAGARRTSAAWSGRPCSRGSRRSPGRWRSGPGGPSRSASRRRRCRGHAPSAS